MQNGLTRCELLPLAGLAFSAFIFNSSEFMPVGLLTDIAADFQMTEAQAGLVISLYAWMVMVLSLPLTIFASRFDFRRLMLGVVAVFCAGQVLSACAVNYGMLVGARLCVAAAHSVFWAIVSPMAVRVVDVRHSGMALSSVVTGSSLAMIVGLPLGRVIGLALSWRMTFACVAAVAVVAFIYLAITLPKMPAGDRFTVRQLPDLFRNRVLVGIFAVVALISTGYYTGYSYIEPYFQQIAGVSSGLVTAALVLFGVAGIVGSYLFARVYGACRFAFVGVALGGVAAALALMTVTPIGVAMVVLVCIVWGASATSFNVALQSEVIRYAKGNTSAVAMACFSGIFNLGIGTGTAIGGAVSTRAGMGLVGLAGAGIAALAVVVYAAVLVRWMRHADARGESA